MAESNKTSEIITQPEGTYWHFLADDRCLRYGDKRKVVVGETLRVDGIPILCDRGLHASEQVIDALSFAPGSTACLVTLGGVVLHDMEHVVPNKSVGQERKVLWMYDASSLLRNFACDVAEEALLSERKAGREPDPRSFDAISVMRRFIVGNATETERFAAEKSAWSSANSAGKNLTKNAAHRVANSASKSAAQSAAESAAWSLAQSAARGAAYSAAWSAGWNAAECASECMARNMTESMAENMSDIKARYAAWKGAESMAKSIFNDQLTRILLAAMARGEGDFPSSNA